MPKQMQLWSDPQEQFQSQQIWKNLDHHQQKNIITALANLISKMVRSQNKNQNQEESHER